MKAESEEPPDYDALLRVWESNQKCQAIPFDDFRLMAMEGWERVKQPQGTGKLAEALAEADRRGRLPASERYVDDRLKRLVGLCAVLQEQKAGAAFHLAANPLADELGIDQTTAARWLRLLVRDGVLVLVSKGHTGRASEYRCRLTL